MTTATPWANRIEGNGFEDPASLLANPYNFRVHSRIQQDVTTAVLDEVGWLQPLTLNVETGHLLDGHMRVLLALQRGEASVPVVYVRLNPDEEKRALLYLHQTGQYAGVDRDILRDVLLDAQTLNQQPGIRQMFDDLGRIAKKALSLAPPRPEAGGLFAANTRPLAQSLSAAAPVIPATIMTDEEEDEAAANAYQARVADDNDEGEPAAAKGSGRGNVEMRERDYGPERLALSVVLTRDNHRRWVALRDALQAKTDSAAVVALLDKLDSGELRLAGEDGA